VNRPHQDNATRRHTEIERPSEGHDLFAPATTELVVERGIEIRERERIPAELRLGN
jgi:hypothetical protein